MSPFIAIGSIFIHQNGPTQVYRQHFSGAVVGPFIAIGSILSTRMGPYKGVVNISQKTQWAHTSVSAVFFSTKNGPTQSYQQHFSGEVVGPFVAIGSIFIHQNGPTQVYRQHFSGKVVGPFIAIGSNFIHKNGPIQGSR